VAIQEFFHLIHVVDDEDEADRFYDRLFAPDRFVQKHWAEMEKRWASLSVVSDLVLEVIEPSRSDVDAHAPLPKFRQRFGQHFHSFAWYVEPSEVRSLFERLRTAGVRVAKPGGGLFAENEDPGNTIFTHPKDTFGQLEFEGKGDHWRQRDPRFQPGWTAAPWREGPLGIERLSHMTTIVQRLDPALSFYEGTLGAVSLHQEATAEVRSAFVLVGPDTIIELAQPVSEGSRMAADLAAHGELPYSATLRVRDLAAAESHIEKLGIGIVDRGRDNLTLDPSDCFGAVWSFTELDVPGDPRAGAAGSHQEV
jgi:catechol 2,3-dioxygenase-like lactoylglutathione lyase family enzyme